MAHLPHVYGNPVPSRDCTGNSYAAPERVAHLIYDRAHSAGLKTSTQQEVK